MITGFIKRMLERYSGADDIAQQRAWVLLLVNAVGCFLSCAVAVFTIVYQSQPISSPDVWIAFTIAGALIFSTTLLMLGNYQLAAHATIALSLAAIWTLIFIRFALLLPHSAAAVYVIAALALPALLLGRFWTMFYGAASMVLLAIASARAAQYPGTTLSAAVGLAVDVATALLLVVFTTILMTHIYEVALQRVRDLLIDQRKTNMALLELTQSLEQSEAQKRQFYRETIYSVTSGKLGIADQFTIDPMLSASEIDVDVHDAASASEARRRLRDFFAAHGFAGTELDSFLIGAGEAITNSVKHADGGRVRCGADDEAVWVAVSDRGPGIESLILPRAVLLPGFSTKPSLGLGYTIMLDVSDSILLKTSDTGTTVVLTKKPRGQMPEGLASWPDAWENAETDG